MVCLTVLRRVSSLFFIALFLSEKVQEILYYLRELRLRQMDYMFFDQQTPSITGLVASLFWANRVF